MRGIKRLDIYLWRELVIPFLIGTVAVVMMFSINQLMAIMKVISVQNVPTSAIVLDLVYSLPQWMNQTLPIGMSLAASLAFTRLTRESELTALRAAGTPILRAILPVAAFGLLVGIGSFLVVEKAMPPAELKKNEIERKVGILAFLPDFQSNIVVRLKDYVASFGSVVRAGETLQLTDVTLVQRPSSDVTRIFTADSGSYKDGIWTLHRPYGWMLKGLTLTGVRPRNDDMVIDQRVIIEDLLSPRTQETQTAAELREAIQNGKKTGLDTRELEVAYHNRFSIPASCIVFAIVGPIFAILFARTGGFAGVLISIFLVMAYYNIYVVCSDIFGRNGWLPPIAAAWLPNVLFAVLGIIGLRRLE